MNRDWIRVSRSHPCPVCNKPDWCCVSRDGEAAICPRTPSDHDLGEAGYLHRLDEPIPQGDWSKAQPVTEARLVDFEAMSRECQAKFVEDDMAPAYSDELGVSQFALVAFGVGWHNRHSAFTFPMRDAREDVIGIRLRSPDGAKFAVKGSRSGLFMGTWTIQQEEQHPPIYICEGPTDAMALFDMGLLAVGRPSCMGGAEHIMSLLRNKKRNVVIVADNDPPQLRNGRLIRPGRKGADGLAHRIRSMCRSLKVIEPYKAKDIRAMSRFGSGRKRIELLVQCAPEWRPM